MITAQELKFQTIREVANLVREFILDRYEESGGMCIDATRYIGRLLAFRGIEFKSYEGHVRFVDETGSLDGYHIWLEVDDVIVDVTADQFNSDTVKFPPVLIAPRHEYPQFQSRREVTFAGPRMEWMCLVETPEIDKLNVGPLEAMVG